MDITLVDALIVLGVGLIAGFINAVAGGGSLLTMPVLMFLGLPPNIANGTNRVAILFGAISSVSGFKSKGVSAYPYSLWLGISALFGSIIGVQIAIDIDGELFKKILSAVMIVIVLYMVFNSKSKIATANERMEPKHLFIGIIVFFFIGIYGGFIQAGIGFLMMTALSSINRFPLAKTNSAKVFVTVTYTIATVIIFAYNQQINWAYGLTLAVGNATGSWFSSRWSVSNGDYWVKRLLIIMVLAFAFKLSGFMDFLIDRF